MVITSFLSGGVAYRISDTEKLPAGVQLASCEAAGPLPPLFAFFVGGFSSRLLTGKPFTWSEGSYVTRAACMQKSHTAAASTLLRQDRVRSSMHNFGRSWCFLKCAVLSNLEAPDSFAGLLESDGFPARRTVPWFLNEEGIKYLGHFPVS